MFAEYDEYDACGLAQLVASGQVTAAELLETALARAAAVDPHLNAICTSMHDIARRRLQEPLQGPFAGVPFLLKDILQDYAGVPTRSGSRATRDWTPPAHSELVQRFLATGVVVFGKTAVPELALKGVTESDRFGATRNPWDTARTPGGSSGGAAAAVAAGIVPMAGGSDGGGSIRIPAAYCGLFGLRPSRGRIPCGPWLREGWEGANSDHVLTRSVRDSAVMLDAICGPDIGAPFVVPRPPRPFAEEARRDPGRLRIAFSTVSPIGRPVAASCVAAVEDAARLLSGLGHEVEPAQPQIDGMALARAFFTMYFGNVAASMKEIRAQTGAGDDEFELGTRLLGAVGRRLPAADYVATLRSWNDFARSLGRFLQRYDLYMTPTVAGPPPRIGEFDLKPAEAFALPIVLALGGAGLLHKAGIVEKTMLQSLERTPFTQLANLTGTPGMSVPLHWDEDGLPVGVQFVAANGEEAVLVRLARQLEQARPWAQRRPPLHAGAHPHPGNAQATSN